MNNGTISIIIGIILVVLLKIFFKGAGEADQQKGGHGVDHDKLFKEDLEFDPSWSVLSSNTHHSDED